MKVVLINFHAALTSQQLTSEGPTDQSFSASGQETVSSTIEAEHVFIN